MKLTTSMVLILAGVVLAAGAATGASLDRSGTWTPTEFYTPTPPGDDRSLINDGSFELGPPPASAWTEVSDWPCEWIGDFSGMWYVSSWDGYNDYWAGGYCYDSVSGQNMPTTSSVTQSVAIPAGGVLSFYYVSYRPDLDDDPADGDRVYVAVDGVEKWSLPFTQANNSYPAWVGPVTVDLSAYGGQSVALTFGGVSVGSTTGNARIDYIELVGGAVPVRESSWGKVKSLYR